MTKPSLNVDELSAEERLDLLEKLWESLRKEPANVPLTEAQREELDRRLDELEADIENGQALGIPWDIVFGEIQKRNR